MLNRAHESLSKSRLSHTNNYHITEVLLVLPTYLTPCVINVF
jgi:hypothetical protein